MGEGWRPGRRGPIMVAMAEQEQPSPVPPGTTGTEPPAAAAAPAPSPSGLRTPAGRRPPTLAGLVAWSVALGLVLLIAVSQNLDGQGAGALSADERDAAGAGGMLEVASKYAVAVKEQGGSGATGLVIEKIRPMVGRPAEELRLAILEAELAGEGGPALKRLAEIDQPGPQTADDVRVLRELYHDGPGAVDEAERQRLFAGAAVQLMPSRFEGFGMVAAEAMAAGVPLVAAAAGSLPEVVDAPRGGVLVPPGDARALADAVDRLLADPGAREALSASARASAERFRWEKVAEDHFAFLQRLAATG